MIRIDRALARKDWSDQPRAPAGQPDGGRWVSDGSGGAGPSPASHTDAVVTEDGSHVLSIRIRADRHAAWDEQHTVTAPDGTRTVFETSGFTQTVRDGETGEILGRSTLAADGAVPEAFVQAIADAVAAEVRASGNYLDARDFGNNVHARIAKICKDRGDPSTSVETSYLPDTGRDVRCATRGTIRLELL